MREDDNLGRDAFQNPKILGRTAPKIKTRKRINLHPLKTVFYLAVLFLLIYLIFFSSFFRIKNIDMDGIKSVEVSDYLQHTLIGKNILIFIPSTYLNTLTTKFPILEQAQLVRGLPSTIKIIAKERKQVLVWCSDSCFNIDNHGYAYESSTTTNGEIPLNDKSQIKVNLGDRVSSPEFINFYLNALERLQEMGLKITEGRIEETSFKLYFRTSENYDIIFDTSQSLNEQLNALKQVLDKNRSDIKEYVDLRVNGIVYVK